MYHDDYHGDWFDSSPAFSSRQLGDTVGGHTTGTDILVFKTLKVRGAIVSWILQGINNISAVFIGSLMACHLQYLQLLCHDDVIKWKHFPRHWPFVWGIHRSPVNSPHKGQWRGALMFSLVCAWINGWVNNSEAGDLNAIALIITSP